jgi:hypothetical protein
MKKTIVASSLVLMLSACSGPAAPPSTPGGPGNTGDATAPPAGEGATWDPINKKAQPGTAESSAGGSPSLLKTNTPPLVKSADFVAGSGNGERISVSVSTVDADGDPVVLEYAWTVNGQPGGNGPALDRVMKRGDFITVTITPFDGKERGRPVTLRSQVTNTPPAIAGIVDVRHSGNLYTARIQASDADGEPIRYALVSGPSDMTVDPVEGTIRWNMPPDYKGRVVFMVSARDQSGAQSTFAGTITVSETFE